MSAPWNMNSFLGMANRNVYCARKQSPLTRRRTSNGIMRRSTEILLQHLVATAIHQKLDKHKKSQTSSDNMLDSFTATDKRSTKASLRVSKILAKAMLLYSHAEIVKECMVEAME